MSEVLIAVVTALLSGGLATMATLKFTRKKAKAEAKVSELDVIEDAIEIWRKTAENLRDEVCKLRDENKILYAEINKLKSINNRILRLLKEITPENVKEIIARINIEHE